MSDWDPGEDDRDDDQGIDGELADEEYSADEVIVATHDPTGTDVALRIAGHARGESVVRHRRVRPVEPEDVAWSGAGPSRRDPQLAGVVLEKVLRRRGWKKQLSIASLMDQWERFVGQVNAEHTTPEKYDEGVLLVRAESTTWATAIRAMAPNIGARMNEILGAGTVTRIDVRGPEAPSWKHGLRSVRGRGPRDTYG